MIRLEDPKDEPQDETALHLLFDYEPLRSSEAKASLAAEGTDPRHHNPEHYWYPPDDIWEQCWTPTPDPQLAVGTGSGVLVCGGYSKEQGWYLPDP